MIQLESDLRREEGIIFLPGTRKLLPNLVEANPTQMNLRPLLSYYGGSKKATSIFLGRLRLG
jgi:hypothetical protein